MGPILAVIFVGVIGTYLLDSADNQYRITERVIAGLDEIVEGSQSYIERKRSELNRGARNARDSVIDYAIESARAIVISWFQEQLSRYLSPFPRIR